MIKIKQCMIVEGKYDKIKLSSLVEGIIITTDGFEIFKNKEKMDLIRMLADRNGLLILTDSDSAGFKIRSYIMGAVPADRITNAYIPDILGKESRKDTYSKEGKIGVEGVPSRIILEALERAGVTGVSENKGENTRQITQTDLYEDGLSGQPQSRQKKRAFLQQVKLPERISTSSLLKILNSMMSYEDYKTIIQSLQ